MQGGKIDSIEFRKLVDTSPRREVFLKADLREMYAYVGLPIASNFSRSTVIQELHRKIRNAFSSGGTAASSHCRQLATALIYSHVLNGTPLEPHLSVAEYLRDALRNSGNGMQEVIGDWEGAVGHAVDHYVLDPTGHHGTDWTRVYTRENQVASAARWLSGQGYQVTLAETKIQLAQKADEKLVDDIDNLVRKMGGINLARRVFGELKGAYDAEQERYHVGRRTSTIGGGQAQIPFAYLLNLAAKHPVGIKPYLNDQATWLRIVALSVCYAALFDVQDYYTNIGFPLILTAIPDYLRGLALHDSLFFVTQIRGSDVVRLLGGLLSDLDSHRKFSDGWTIDEVLKVTSAILNISSECRGPVALDLTAIWKSCSQIERVAVDRVLKRVLSHPPPGANQNFSRPTDVPVRDKNGRASGGQDFFVRPLLRLGENSYCLLDRAVCGTGFIEAIFDKLRPEMRNFDDGRGKLIEKYLAGEFRSHGVPVVSGDYSVGGSSGQCDLVVETDRAVIFVEIKKKALTRHSRAGSPAHILIDLAESLIDALLQAGKHELVLRRNEAIDLEDSGLRTTIRRGGRGIEKIVVTLLDFGGFQDRVVLKQFLEATTQVSYNVDSADLEERFEGLNASIKKLKTQTTELSQLKASNQQPYFECWFLSVPQILLLLDNVEDQNGFRERLWRTRHMIWGSQDFYFEFAQANRLRLASH